MSGTLSFIIVRLIFEATHYWPDAPLAQDYLRNKHRHEFYITCKIEVTHDNREIEFISFKNEIMRHLLYTYPDHNFGTRSCEQIARELLEQFNLAECQVFEDNENGACIIKT